MNKLSLVLLTLCLTAYSLTSLSLEYAEDPFLKSKSLASPEREYSLIATDEGYYPKSLIAYEGETVKIFLTSTEKNPSCFMLPAKNIFIGATQGKMAETQIYFDKAGHYEFFCPSGKIKGSFQVFKKMSEEEKQKREIASERKLKDSQIPVKVWRPTELPREE